MEYRLQSMYSHMVGRAATAVFNTPWLFQMMLHAMPDSQLCPAKYKLDININNFENLLFSFVGSLKI